jgi:hypothetical protein
MYLHCLFVVIVSFEGQMFFAIFMYYHYPVFLMSHDVLYDDYTMVVALIPSSLLPQIVFILSSLVILMFGPFKLMQSES